MDIGPPLKALFTAVGGVSVLTALDVAPFLTIAVTVFCSIVSGVMAYRFANREAQKRIEESFKNHLEAFHSDHEKMLRRIEENKNVLR